MNGQCEVCKPYCTGRVCGGDGCGGTCGRCNIKSDCNESTGQCMPYRVTGRIILETQQVTYSGDSVPRFSDTADVPGSNLPISLYTSSGKVLGETTTAEDGSFYFEMERLPIVSDWLSIVPAWYVDDSLKLGIFVAKTADSKPYDLWTWSIRLSNYSSVSDPGDLGDVRITIEQASGGLFVYRHLQAAYEQLSSHGFGKTLSQLPSMGVLWKPEFSWDCGTCFVNSSLSGLEFGKKRLEKTMYISGHSAEESAWGYPTLLHEFGHYVLFQIKDDSPGGQHIISQPSDPRLAWSEGFATLYALMSMSWTADEAVTQYWRILRSGSYWLDYAHLYDDSGLGTIYAQKPSMTHESGMKQSISEAWVTSVLWDLFDGDEIAEDNGDGVALGGRPIFEAITSSRYRSCNAYNYDPSGGISYRTYVGTDLVDFIDAVICAAQQDGDRSLADNVMDLLIDRGFPYDRTPVCKAK